MSEVIAFPSGPDLVAARARAVKRLTQDMQLARLARSYVRMNHITSEKDIFVQGGRVAQTALEFVEQVCKTIGYHKPEQTSTGGDIA